MHNDRVDGPKCTPAAANEQEAAALKEGFSQLWVAASAVEDVTEKLQKLVNRASSGSPVPAIAIAVELGKLEALCEIIGTGTATMREVLCEAETLEAA